MLNDLRHACRQLAQSPGFSAVAVLILATGIGATTAVFTVIDTLLVRALPVRDPGALVMFSNIQTTTSGATTVEQFSYLTFEHLRDNGKSLAAIAAIKTWSRSLAPNPSDPNDAMRVRSNEVSGGFFKLLGVSAGLGRTLSPDDDKKGGGRPVVVLSHSLWQRRFGADPDILSKTVMIDNVQFNVIGVMPRSFFGIEPAQPADIWIPIQTIPLFEPGTWGELERSHLFMLMGRLGPGIERAAASAELDVLYQAQGSDQRAGAAARDRASTWGKLQLEPGGSGRMERRHDTGQLLVTLLVVVGFVLVIACANVASLMLARSAARQHELAVRAALGAGRRRLASQLMAEGIVLSAAGGLLGLLIVRWVIDALSNRFDAAQFVAMQVDLPVLTFVLLVSVMTGILVGLLPTLKFSRVDVNAVLKDQSTTSTGGQRQKALRVLVVTQIAVSVCLLAGAGVFIRTLQTLKEVDVGFRRGNLLLVNVSMPVGYVEGRQVNLAKELLASVEGLPGVKSATLTVGGLWDGSQYSAGIGVEGYTPKPNEDMKTFFAQVGPNFFEHMGIALLRGRGFAQNEIFVSDFFHPQRVVINESFARRFFGDADPLGRTINVLSGKAEIVGVAKNVKYTNLRDDNSLQLYLPFGPRKGLAQFTVSLRTEDSPKNLIGSVGAVIQRIDSNARAGNIQLMDEWVSRFVMREQLIAGIAGYFGMFALLLACLGLYGLLAYDVAQRTRELGVRLALGARGSDLISLVVKQGMTLAALGCLIGFGGAFGLVHFVASKLYGVSAMDPVTFGGTTLLLLLVSLIACWLPSYRATKTDPMIALRAQ